MNKNVLFIFLLFLVPLAQAEPFATSYWGYVTVDGITKTNALVTVLDPAGKEIARATSTQSAMYQVTVPWDDPATQADEGVVDGEAITFNVDGSIVTSRRIDAKGTNTRFDLDSGVKASGKGSSGGSSSGGGGVSAESYESILKKESREELLSKDAPKTYSFSTPELSVSQIVITSNINAGLVNVQVELLKNRSALASVDAPGNVYKYLNIWVGSSGFAIPKNIKEGVVKFKLPNSWITSNGFTDSDIKMLKWNGMQWITLATEKKNSDEKFTYYEANTTSFSPFAISGVKETAAPAASPEATAVTTGIPKIPPPVTTKKSPGFGIVLAIAGLIVIYLKKRSY